MKKMSFKYLLGILRFSIVCFVLVIISLLLFSFAVHKMDEAFLKQLGISKIAANEKIAGSILGGYLDTYGVKNVKNIVQGNRTAVANDLLVYTRQYVNSAAFKKEYAILKEKNKPTLGTVQTPEQMRQANIDQYKKSVNDNEAILKKADASTKPIFEKVLAEVKKHLKEAEDPNNKAYVRYTKGYPQFVQDNEQRNNLLLQQWEDKYPADYRLFVKQRLLSFLEVTKDIDFEAELTVKNGRKVFVNPVYEKQKGSYWKMGFRAGKEVVAPARVFVQQWLDDLK